MKFFAVEPPRCESDGDGEDTREWFPSRAAAMKRYRELVKLGGQVAKLREKARRAKTTRTRCSLWEDLNEIDPGWACDMVSVSAYVVPTDKDGLLRAIQSQFRNCEEVLACWRG